MSIALPLCVMKFAYLQADAREVLGETNLARQVPLQKLKDAMDGQSVADFLKDNPPTGAPHSQVLELEMYQFKVSYFCQCF